MKNTLYILITFILLACANNLTGQQDFYYIADASNDALNGIYQKAETIEIHEKDFYVFVGPLPSKRYTLRPVEYPFPMYQWKIVDTESEAVQFFSTETPYPNPPAKDWRSKSGGELTIAGPMLRADVEKQLRN